MTYAATFHPHATYQLQFLKIWVAEQSGYPDRADDFISQIVEYCDKLAEYPLLGRARDDIRVGIRVAGFRRRVSIAYEVKESTIVVLGIYYGGRNIDLPQR